MEPADPVPANVVGSVLKAIRLIELVAEHDGEISLSDLARRAGYPIPTTHRLLSTLEQGRWLTRGKLGGYVISLHLAEIAGGVLADISLRDEARPWMQELCEVTGETCYLALRQGDQVLCIERIESRDMVRLMTWDIGKTLPLSTGGSSLAILAHLPKEEVRSILSKHLPTSKPAGRKTREYIERQIEAAQVDGYAVSAEQITPGVASIGAPVFDAAGAVTAAVSVGGLAAVILERKFETVSAAVVAAATQISRSIGYTGPYPPRP